MAVSLSAQCAFAGAVIFASLLHFEQLPVITPRMPLPPVPRLASPVVELVRTPPQLASSSSRPLLSLRRALQIPSRIPTEIPKIVESLSEIAAGAPAFDTVGTYADGVTGGVLSSVLDQARHAVAPPATRPEPAHHDAAPVQRIEVGGKVQEAKLIHRVIPEYPALARAMRLAGKVQLVATIGIDGKVQSLRIIGGHPLLIQASVNAVRQWVYTPTLLNGKPVEVVAPIDVNFTMTN